MAHWQLPPPQHWPVSTHGLSTGMMFLKQFTHLLHTLFKATRFTYPTCINSSQGVKHFWTHNVKSLCILVNTNSSMHFFSLKILTYMNITNTEFRTDFNKKHCFNMWSHQTLLVQIIPWASTEETLHPFALYFITIFATVSSFIPSEHSANFNL